MEQKKTFYMGFICLLMFEFLVYKLLDIYSPGFHNYVEKLSGDYRWDIHIAAIWATATNVIAYYIFGGRKVFPNPYFVEGLIVFLAVLLIGYDFLWTGYQWVPTYFGGGFALLAIFLFKKKENGIPPTDKKNNKSGKRDPFGIR